MSSYSSYDEFYEDLKVIMNDYNRLVSEGPKKEENLFRFFLE